MSYDKTIQLWKDPDSREPQPDGHPAGDLLTGLAVVGGAEHISTEYIFTLGCCGGFTDYSCGC